MLSMASTLSSLDSNVKNLQERAHVWDTFQLHVAAWNDQMSTLDKKVDILSRSGGTHTESLLCHVVRICDLILKNTVRHLVHLALTAKFPLLPTECIYVSFDHHSTQTFFSSRFTNSLCFITESARFL